MILLNSLEKANIFYIFKKDVIIIVKEAWNQIRARRMAWKNIKDLNFFAESFSFLILRFRHFYYDERGHLINIAVSPFVYPKHII